MKKINLFLSFFLVSIASIHAQDFDFKKPDSSGAYIPGETTCVSPEENQRIQQMLTENIALLKQQGKLPQHWGEPDANTAKKPTAGNFIWPLQPQPGLDYNSYYGISNYVDLDPLFPNNVQDWNCGSRSYDDASGYNHGGIDIFLWPFPQQMQEQELVAIIAATDGIIIGKDDGYPDHSCALTGLPWNAVYIGNTDGTVCWYGHMKKNSQATKAIGEHIDAGEFLGFVGSAGNSTGPHLHFETHDVNGNVVDPFTGPCNNSPSLWAQQKPYYEPTINALITESAPPDIPECPNLETIHKKDYFQVGDDITFSAFFHDMQDDTVFFELVPPGNQSGSTWNYNSNAGMHYPAFFAYWNNVITSDWPQGQWNFKATYVGNTVNHTFYIGVDEPPSSIDKMTNEMDEIQLYPNPSANGNFTINGLKALNNAYFITISDLYGRTIERKNFKANGDSFSLQNSLGQGMYLVKISNEQGGYKTMKLSVIE